MTLNFLANFKWKKTRALLDQVERDYFEASDGKLKFEINLQLTNFTDIKWYGLSEPLYIDSDWYDQNVSPLGKEYTMVALGLPHDQWKAPNSIGWCTDNSLGPFELHLDAGYTQRDMLYGVPWLVHVLEHEMSHALHLMEQMVTHSGKPDPTHTYLGNTHNLKGSLASLDYEAINQFINPKPMNQTKVVLGKDGRTVYEARPIAISFEEYKKQASVEGIVIPNPIPKAADVL